MSRNFRFIITILPLGFILGGILSVWLKVNEPGRFPFRSIEIQNELKWMPPQSITEVVSNYLSQGFFGIDVEAIQRHINHLPWVLQSEVQRIWPDRISISVVEQSPLAHFGEKAVLSTEGKVFYPEASQLPAGYPKFNGPEKSAKEMLKQYLDFLEMLSPLGLSIAELNLSEDGVYKILLDNDIAIILGKNALAERLSRFILVYPSQIKKEIDRIAYLDLRYTNGIAIGWKSPRNISYSHNQILCHAHSHAHSHANSHAHSHAYSDALCHVLNKCKSNTSKNSDNIDKTVDGGHL